MQRNKKNEQLSVYKMSTENQALASPSLAILYENALYQIDPAENKIAAAPIPETTPASGMRTMEEPLAARSGVLIIVRDKLANKGTTHTMFLNLLSACNLSLEKVDLISPYTIELSIYDLLKKYTPTKIILFGVASSEIGLSLYFPDYQVQDVDGLSYLTAPDLMLIENNPELKKKLWQSLKKFFSL